MNIVVKMFSVSHLSIQSFALSLSNGQQEEKFSF